MGINFMLMYNVVTLGNAVKCNNFYFRKGAMSNINVV